METTRLFLHKLTKTDFEEVFDLQRNDATRRYLGGPVSEKSFEEKFRNMLNTKQPISFWIAREKDTLAFIGLVSIDTYHDTIHYEVSYELHPTQWGKGYGTEIVDAVIDYAFDQLGLEELYAETQKANAASIRVLEKVGMKFQKEITRFGEQQVVYSIRSK